GRSCRRWTSCCSARSNPGRWHRPPPVLLSPTSRFHMIRATKIVATIGPASSSPEIFKRMLEAGVNVVRFNFSHGKAQDHIDRAEMVRKVAAEAGREIAIMADLQGPKIRI